MKPIISILRPHQWVKNCFVLLPLFFNGGFLDVPLLLSAMTMTIAFCFAASGIYCLNDICDVEADRLHPKKCLRPVACGAVSKRSAFVLMTLCMVASISLVCLFPWQVEVDITHLLGIILLYLLMNIAYCVRLKQIAIVDVFIIAAGYVLRIIAGAMATGVFLSYWMVLMTFLLALFLAFSKRRDDVVMYEETNIKARNSIARYNLPFMNQVIGILASITMVCYIMYTVSPEVTSRFHSPFLYVTSAFVLAGIIRYLQITIVDMKSGSPTKVLLEDRFVQATVLGWLIAFIILIYADQTLPAVAEVLTERDIPITRPENYKYTPEEIALLKKQANEAYLKWVELELEISRYTLEQTAQK